VCHVGSNKVAGGEGGAERQLTSKNTSGNNTRELTRVVTRVRRVSSADAKKIEHGGLGLEDCTTTDSTNFDTRHRDRDLKVSMKAGQMLAYDSTNREYAKTYFFMTVIH